MIIPVEDEKSFISSGPSDEVVTKMQRLKQMHLQLRIEMQIFGLHWMMQNIRLFNVCEARRASRRH